MRIDHILKAAAKRMTGISVHIDTSYETVCISDDAGIADDIFMQGDDAATFIAECDAMASRCKHLDFGVIELALAEPYIDNLWN